MLRISAVLAILVGVFLAYKTAAGIWLTYSYSMGLDETYVVEHFALEIAFALAPIVGAILALWLGWRAGLAAAWGIILGLASPHLIRPSIPIETVRQMMATHGGTSGIVGVDPTEIVLVAFALVGLGLCIAHEIIGGATESR